MSLLAHVFPFPLFSVALVLAWLLLQGDASLGNVLLAVALAIVLPLSARPMLPELPTLRRPLALARYLVLVLGDILVSNVRVARLALGPMSRLRPCIVEVPLDVEQPVVVAMLAMTITLTPGTVSLVIDSPGKRLLVHGLDVDDPSALVAEIKERYERRLKEIFGC
jgi:multicomponent K+:H+ antiporter subunit E